MPKAVPKHKIPPDAVDSLQVHPNQKQAFPGFGRQLWRAVFPDPLIPKTEAERKRFPRKNFLIHFRPATVPESTLALSLSWGLGGMAAVLVLVQMVSGILLKFVYEPSPALAYASVQHLITAVPFGRLIRNIHFWGANLLAAVVFLHMLRVFFTGAFHFPRQFNWIIGLMLFVSILFSNFTGYLLPWDQLAYWAVTISTGMLEYIPRIGIPLQQWVRGGPELGPETLRLFYAVHTALLPVMLTGLAGFHFWRVRKAGGLVMPPEKEGTDPESAPASPKRVPVIPNLLVREAAMTSVILSVLMVLSVCFDAPLAASANPGLSPDPTKAPWYFAGFQELLLHVHPSLAVFVLPLLAGCALILIPFIPYETCPAGVWFISRTGRRSAAIAVILGFVFAVSWVGVDAWLNLNAGDRVDASKTFSGGMIFLGIAIVTMLSAGWGMIRKGRMTRNEIIQALFVLAASGFMVFTFINALFRSQGMALTWPG